MKQLLAEIFSAYYTDVYTYLYSLCHDAGLAEDLTSEVFLSIVKSISTFRGESELKTWLFTIARRKWIDHLRKEQRRLPTVSLQELWNGVAVPGPEEEESLPEILQQLLEREPEQTRAVVQLRLEGYSYYEIAARTGISESSARVIFFRTKAKLRKQLEKEGILP